MPIKIFSSHNYKSARNLESAVDAVLQEHPGAEITIVPRDMVLPKTENQIFRGYDVVIRYRGNDSSGTLIREIPSLYTLLEKFSYKVAEAFRDKQIGDFVFHHELLVAPEKSKNTLNVARVTMCRLRKKIEGKGYTVRPDRRGRWGIFPYSKSNP